MERTVEVAQSGYVKLPASAAIQIPLVFDDPKTGRRFVIPRNKIFVFGSNLAGIHGAGAAAFAYHNFDAEFGRGRGRTGRAYAIPTRRNPRHSLDLKNVKMFVDEFISHARQHIQEEFYVTKIGCGFAGFTEEQIAPLFNDAPINCELPEGWRVWLSTNEDEDALP